MHFWCNGFAKETFVFFSVCWLSYKIFQQKRISISKSILILIPVFFIRPHYVIFFVLTIIIYNYVKSDRKFRDLLIYVPVILASIYLLVISAKSIISLTALEKFLLSKCSIIDSC